MRNIVFVLAVFLSPFAGWSQISAITQFGEKVILHDDFTWSYAGETHQSPKIQISDIEIDSLGMVSVVFWSAGNSMVFYDGKIFNNNLQTTQISYHENSFFEKSVGKIKQIGTGSEVITFDYHENFIFAKSEGKIKRISFGNTEITFDYHQISFFAKSEGKIKEIASGSNSVTFEYFENTIYSGIEGKLKARNGQIPGINIRYLE
jgi:hypothetical protein